MKKQLLFLIFGLLIAYAALAQEIAYNNFGADHNGWNYTHTTGWTIAGENVEAQYGVEQALGFEAAASGFVTDIWVAISYVPLSSPADTVIIYLVENPDGLPPDSSNIMEEWLLTDFEDWHQWNEPIHLTGNFTSFMEAGNSYWLWAIAGEATWTMWCVNEDPSLTCPHTLRREGEDWKSISLETAGAFRVDVGSGVGMAETQKNTGMLHQNFPNPFSSETSIKLSVGEPSAITVKIYNMFGIEVCTLFDGFCQAGENTLTYNARNIPSGIYFCTMTSGGRELSTIKMNIMH